MQNKYSKNFLIGVSFLVALVLVYFGVNFLKGVNVFKKQNTYVVVFDNVTGLYASSPIYVNGFQVGLVSDMKMLSNNPVKFAVNINLEGNYRIPKGSTIEFGSDFLGATAASIIANTETDEYYVPGDTLFGKREADMMKMVAGVIPKADSLLIHLDSAVLSINELMNSELIVESLQGVKNIVGSLDEGTVKLNQLMVSLNKDVPEITNNISGITHNLKDISDDLNNMDLEKIYVSIDNTLENIEELVAKINRDDTSVGKLMNDTQLHDSLTNTLSSVSQLLDDIRQDPKKYLSVKVRLF